MNMQHGPRIDLQSYRAPNFSRGRSAVIEALWIIASALFVQSFLPGSRHRRFLLNAFGAKVASTAVLKPGVRVKFPWRLTVGENTWIGEDAWVDNLADVVIGANCCISQGAYLCTGDHDWSKSTFDLKTSGIVIEDGAWIAANATVGPGVTVQAGAVLALGSTASKTLNAWTVYRGNPAEPVATRTIKEAALDEC